MGFWDTILSIVFPPKCVLCGRTGPELCRTCISFFQPAERESAAWIFPLFDYRDPAVKKSLHKYKYNGKKRLAPIFAEALYGKIMEELSELGPLHNFSEPILIPIPLSGRRLRERGYNQSELLCRELILISRAVQGPLQILDCRVLSKPKETPHQARISLRQERFRNMEGSFDVSKAESIRGKNIILIDDILTTGATLSAARKILRKSGAKRIVAFTIAH